MTVVSSLNETMVGADVEFAAGAYGLPQSQVSAAVARLREAGSVQTVPDPHDGRRVLVRPVAEVSERVAHVRAAGIESALAAALGSEDPQRLSEVTGALDVLARNLMPATAR